MQQSITVELTRNQLIYLKFLVDNDVKQEPEYVSKSEAYRRFGQAHVMRWIRQRRVLEYKRPGVIHLSLAQLREAAAERQDYLFP